MRGGMTVGKLVHKRGGALFGPAMNEAYAIESQLARFPRVVVSEQAFLFLNERFMGLKCYGVAIRDSDGVPAFDIISFFLNWKYYHGRKTEIHKQLLLVEKDISERSPTAHPKIEYLLQRWSKYEDQFTDAENTD